MDLNEMQLPAEMPAEFMASMGALMEGQRALIEAEQLNRIEAKLDRLLAFDAQLVDLLEPLIPKKIAAVVLPALRKVLR